MWRTRSINIMEEDQKKKKYSFQKWWQRKAALEVADSNQNGFLLWSELVTGEERLLGKITYHRSDEDHSQQVCVVQS